MICTLIMLHLLMSFTGARADEIPVEGLHTDWQLVESTVTPLSPKAGELVSFQASVGIVTLIDPLPQIVNVTLYLDGDLYYSTSLTFTRPLDVITVQTYWIATEGEHSVKWVIDPNLLYEDPDLENNVIWQTFTVEEAVEEIEVPIKTYEVVVSVSGIPFPYYTPIIIDDVVVGALSEEAPLTFTFLEDTSHNVTVYRYINGTEGVRYHCPNNVWICSTSDEHAFTYDAEYRLTIISEYDAISGYSWHKKGEQVTVSVSPEVPMNGFWGTLGGKMKFERWSGDLDATTPTATILMDEPKTVTVVWEADYTTPSIIVVGIISILIISGILVKKAPWKVTPTAPLPEAPSCAEVRKKFNELKSRLKHELKGIKGLWDSFQEARDKEAESKARLVDAEGDAEKARKALQKLEQEKAAWEKTYETARISGIPTEEIDRTFDRLFKSYKKRMEEYRKKIDKAKDELQKREKARRGVEEELEAASGERERLQAEIDGALRRIGECEAGIRGIIEKWPHCINCDDVNDLLKAKNDRLNEVEEALKRAEKEANDAREGLEKLKEKRDDLRDKINKRDERLDEIREELKRLFDPFTEKPSGFDEAKTKGWMELVPGVKAYFLGNKGAEDLIKHFDKVGKNYGKLRDEFKELEGTRDEDEEKLENTDREIKNAEERLKLAEDSLKKLGDEKRGLEENIGYLEGKYAECVEKLSDCKDETGDLLGDLQKTLDEYDEMLRRADRIIGRVERQKERVEGLRGKFERAFDDLKRITTELRDILKFINLEIPEFTGLWDWAGSFSTTLGYFVEDLGKFTIPTDTIKLVGELYGLFQKTIDPRTGGWLATYIAGKLGYEELESIREALVNARPRRLQRIVRDIHNNRRALNGPLRTINDNTPRLRGLRENGKRLIDDVRRQLDGLKDPKTLDECQRIRADLVESIRRLREEMGELTNCINMLEKALKSAADLLRKLESDIFTIASTAKGLKTYKEILKEWINETPIGDIAGLFSKLWPF